MSNDFIKKNERTGSVENNVCAVSEEDMRLINTYTRRELSSDGVYVFSVVLCDNDIDRDGERFTVEALFALEKLFVGKTGIMDHTPSAKNQTARIFECSVEAVDGVKTAKGDDYFRLKARAYMPKTESNADIITAIDSGIIREVSVGCAVEKSICSICGEEIHICPHKSGEVYNGRLCCGELTNPYDAYEWSFVAVPSQKKAGVTKSHNFERKETDMEEILKNIETGKGFAVSDSECGKLKNYINSLKQSAKDGIYYRDTLSYEVLRLSATIQPDISRETMENVVKFMTVAQLKEFKDAFEKQKNKDFAPVPQLYREKNNKTNNDLNGQFRI